MLDGDATRDRILKTIAGVARQTKAQDSLIIFYAGHGIAVGDRYYLLPQDLAFDGPPGELHDHELDALQRSAISDLDLQSALSGEQAAVAALILDACQSGEVVGDKLAQRRGPMNSRGLAQMAYDKRMFILAASLSTQTAAEQEALEHGVLTYALVQEGLADDMASPRHTPMGPSLTTLTEWLHWGANRVAQGASSTSNPRGFAEDQKKLNAQWPPVQEPRLFAPPDSQGDVTVALHAISLDPETLTTEGYTQSTPATPAASAMQATAPLQDVVFPASTLGSVQPGLVLLGGHEALVASSGQLVGLDLDHSAVLWRQTFGGDPISLDVSPSGQIVVLDTSGNVWNVNRSATAETKVIVKGFGFNLNGLVRWLKPERQLLVVTDKSVALYNPDGNRIRSVDLPNAGARAPILAQAGNWLYLADWKGEVLSYQVPSLTPGAVLQSESPAQSPPSGAVTYVASIVIDPAARHLIRIFSDGSFTQAQLPSLTLERSVIPEMRVRAASFSSDGATLFVANTTGTIQTIDTLNGAVKGSWPAMLDSIDAITSDPQDSLLIASGNGGITAWDLKNGKVRCSIPGGAYFTTATFSQLRAIDVMLAGKGDVRTFHLPASGETSKVAMPEGLFISHSWMMGKSSTTLSLWDRLNVNKMKELQLAGDGRLYLTPDGRNIAWTSSLFPVSSLEVLETATGRAIKTVPLPNPASAFALSADGHLLIYTIGEQLHQVPLDSGPETETAVPQAPCCVAAISPSNDELRLASNLGVVMLMILSPSVFVAPSSCHTPSPPQSSSHQRVRSFWQTTRARLSMATLQNRRAAPIGKCRWPHYEHCVQPVWIDRADLDGPREHRLVFSCGQRWTTGDNHMA